jgi:hypothetical protein
MRGRERLPEIVALSIAAVALVIAVSLHSFFLRAPGPVGFDDGYTVALGERLIDGRWLPYVDGCSHRGPMLYWLTALAQKIFGRFDWVGPRWLVFLSALTTLGGLVGIGFAARMPLAGAFGALFYVWLAMVAHDIEPAFALTGEAVAATFGVVALLFVTLASSDERPMRRRLVLLALAGASAGLAGFTKQTAFPMIAPLALWVVAMERRWTLLAALGGGFFVPAAIIVGRYAIAGELGTFWYWFYTYNAQIYMEPFRNTPYTEELGHFIRRQPWVSGAIAILCASSLVRPVLELERFPKGFAAAWARVGLEVTTALVVLVTFFAISTPKRYWLPYFVVLFPFIALLLGTRAEALCARAQNATVARITAPLVLGTLLTVFIGIHANLRMREMVWQRRSGMWQPGLPETMCDLVWKHSGPGDSLFVWGFDSDLNVSCKRHVATRYTYSTLVAGTVPPFFADVKLHRVARGAREHTIEDLNRSRPNLILDMTDRMRGVSLRVVPELARYVDTEYCRLPDRKTKGGRPAAVYLRRDLPGCAPVISR